MIFKRLAAEPERKSVSIKVNHVKSSRSMLQSEENGALSSVNPNKTFQKSNVQPLKMLPPLRTLNSFDERNSVNSKAILSSTAVNIEPAIIHTEGVEQDENNEPRDGKVERMKLPIYPNIYNMKEWKKKHKLDPKVKVYIVTGGYGDVKKALDKRGWIQNPDPKSRCFDLRWTIKSKEHDIKYLEDFQLVNHFEKNASITTKVGLCRNLRNIAWFSNADMNAFYPKCYDLSDEKDYEDFIEEFKYNKAESILKLYVRVCQEKEALLMKEMEETVLVAASVCEKKLRDPDEILEECGEWQQVKITDEEWKIISKDEISVENLAKKKYEARLAKYENVGVAKKTKKKGKRKIIDAKKVETRSESVSLVQLDEKLPEAPGSLIIAEEKNELLERVKLILERFKARNPQDGLVGDRNIWMLKPGGLSRGRGITCMKNLIEILDTAKKTANQWVVQKYIENPLIIHTRKFDIRQWVLVTDWNPLTIWFYDECYVRFSGDQYNADDLENRYVHLTNNSVTKHLKGSDDQRFEQNMWRMETFQNYLKEKFGRDVFAEIQQKMKQAVIWSLESAQDMIGNRKSSFELYGYDFMVDEDFNVWLIEINLSPSLDYSTAVTKRLVKMVSEDVIKVVVDHNMAKKKQRSDIPTGLFSCIHKSKRCVDKPANSFGLDLVCEGTGIPIEKQEKQEK